MNEFNSLLFYILGVNIIALMLMWIDKSKAKKRAWRIPERTFWSLAIIGGALGIWIGMKSSRHKTKHRSFVVGVPIIIVVHLGLLAYAYFSLS